MKNQIFNKEYIYPSIWNDEDIIKFKYYLKESKTMYSLPEDLLTLCIEREINEQKGLITPIDHSKIEKIDNNTPFYEVFDSVEV